MTAADRPTRRVLMVSPHFPPDTSAGAHRVRLLAPHLARYGWEPTVATIDPVGYEGRLDPALLDMVPSSLRVVRARAIAPRTTRRFGIGDLGIRSFSALYQSCSRLLRDEHFDALFITIYPAYTALLGPLLKRRFSVPFVLDYQDPWVGSWGATVGGGTDGTPDFKSRASRLAARMLEPVAVNSADAVTAVSAATYEDLRRRNAHARNVPCAAIPLGGEPRDFDFERNHPRVNRWFTPGDGLFHLCYVGTLLPLGFETLRALLSAVAQLRDVRPELYRRLRLHFFGTSNQTTADASQRVLPIARELEVSDIVTEVTPRIDYLDALTVQLQASGLLLLGSSERHYTASKLYPALLANRPVLAVYHEDSPVVETMRGLGDGDLRWMITYGDTVRAGSRKQEIFEALCALMTRPRDELRILGAGAGLFAYSAQTLAGNLANILDTVTQKNA
jgi:hypothetical protein